MKVRKEKAGALRAYVGTRSEAQGKREEWTKIVNKRVKGLYTAKSIYRTQR